MKALKEITQQNPSSNRSHFKCEFCSNSIPTLPMNHESLKSPYPTTSKLNDSETFATHISSDQNLRNQPMFQS